MNRNRISESFTALLATLAHEPESDMVDIHAANTAAFLAQESGLAQLDMDVWAKPTTLHDALHLLLEYGVRVELIWGGPKAHLISARIEA